MKIEEKVPTLAFQATNNVQATLSDYLGKWLILYFYPKDATPGCTLEGQEFRNAYPQIQALNADVLGVSRDTITSHEKFKCKQQFPFELISDTDESLCKQFDVIKIKSLYGKQVRGIERSTFLIDPGGILKYEWRKLSVSGHVNEVLATLKNLAN